MKSSCSNTLCWITVIFSVRTRQWKYTGIQPTNQPHISGISIFSKILKFFVVMKQALLSLTSWVINSLASGGFQCNFQQPNVNDWWLMYLLRLEIALRWMSLDLTDDMPSAVQVIAWAIRQSLKRKCLHFGEIFITGCTGSCQNDNFQCSQWLKFRQNDDIFVSVMLTMICVTIWRN